MWGCHNHYAYEPQFDDSNANDAYLGRFLKGMYTKDRMYTLNDEYISV